MRLRRVVAAAAFSGVAALACPAGAQYVSWRASLAASGSYSKSLSDAPYPSALTFAGPSLSLTPSGVLLFDTPLTTNTLTYAFSLTLPFTKDLQLTASPLSYNNRLTYSGRYDFNERTSMSLTLGLSHSPLHAAVLATDPTEAQLDPVPGSAAYLLNISAQESITRQLSETLTLMQSNGVTLNEPIDPALVQAKTYAFSNSANLNKTLASDTLGLLVSVMTTYFTAGEGAGGAVTPPHVQIADTLSLTWSRPLTPTLSASAQLGLTQVISPGLDIPTAIEPTGNATLTYLLDPSTVSLSLAHQAAPNLLTGSVNFTDTGTLRFSLPFDGTTWLATGSGGFTHMTPIGALGAVTNVILGDASIAYRPPSAPSLSISVRGQLQKQVVVDSDSGFTRLSASFSLTYSYPSTTAAQLPTRMPPALGATPYVPGGGEEPPARLFEVPAEETPAPAPAPARKP